MTRAHQAIVAGLVSWLIAGSVAAESVPHTYMAPALAGIVTETGTARPLVGVAILVRWAGVSRRTWEIAEARTGPDGRFSVAGWGPRSLPEPIGVDSPQIFCYKAGYEFQPIGAGRCMPAGGPYVSELRRSAAPPQERAWELQDFIVGLLLLPATLPQPTLPQMFGDARAEFLSLPAGAKADQSLKEFDTDVRNPKLQPGLPYSFGH